MHDSFLVKLAVIQYTSRFVPTISLIIHPFLSFICLIVELSLLISLIGLQVTFYKFISFISFFQLNFLYH